MRIGRFWILAIATCGAPLVACSPSSPPSFVESARTAGTLTVYEGVPQDRSLMRTGPVKRMFGETFHATPHEVGGAEAKAIAATLSDPDTFRSHVENKKCGGFHADYAVAWPGDGGPRTVLLCFGCGEMRSIGDGAESLIDLTEEGQARLEKLLSVAVQK